MSYLYHKLGVPCEPITVACTSNHKFLPLKASVYRKQYTYMMQYPGTTLPQSYTNPQPSLVSHLTTHLDTPQTTSGRCTSC